MKPIELACAIAALAACRGQERSSGTTSAPSAAPPPTSAPTPATASSPAASAPVTAASIAPRAAPVGESAKWTFDDAPAGAPPPGFSFGRTGDGKPGVWAVRAEPGAPSGANVLAQTDPDSTDYRFPVAWANSPSLADLDLQVRCKPISGKVDQACGLVFRLRDANNYYLTRANALENNVRLYYVKDGKRTQISSYSGKVTGGTWHTLRILARRDEFQVFWDGAKVLEQKDKTFPDAGKVGVWTKADSVTYFDDLTVSPPST
jgi:hypothetical protein